MDGVNDAVVKQLKERKGGEDVLPLWEGLWTAYQGKGLEGVNAVINDLLNTASESLYFEPIRLQLAV